MSSLATQQNKWPKPSSHKRWSVQPLLPRGSGMGMETKRLCLAGFAAQMAGLRYSRQDELEADALGVRIMSEAGYDPRAMLGVMQISPKPAREDVSRNFSALIPTLEIAQSGSYVGK